MYEVLKHYNDYTTFEDFEKSLLSNGFNWDEVEFYWRNPREYEKALAQIQENQRNADIERQLLGL